MLLTNAETKPAPLKKPTFRTNLHCDPVTNKLPTSYQQVIINPEPTTAHINGLDCALFSEGWADRGRTRCTCQNPKNIAIDTAIAGAADCVLSMKTTDI